MTGLMVGLLLAGLIGVYLWWSHRSAPSAAQPNGEPAVVPSGDSGLDYGGITFVTDQGPASRAASTRGATAYDITDPTTASRRVDAVDRATAATALAAQTGLTADQLYQQHLHQELDPNTPTNSKAPITGAQKWDSASQTWIAVVADPRTTQWSF